MDKQLSTNRGGSVASANLSKTIDANRFAAYWARLCAAYPRQEISAATAEMYFEHLKDYSEAEVSDAIAGVVAGSKWFPTIAEILDEIAGERQCPHQFVKAELRVERAQLRSEQAMFRETSNHVEARLDRLRKEIGELEAKKLELYERERQMLERSGLAKARAELEKVKSEIVEQQRILALIRSKVKLLDQARILQAEEASND